MTVITVAGAEVGARSSDGTRAEGGRRAGDGPPGPEAERTARIEATARARSSTIQILQLVMEVLDGRRPVEQLLRVVTEDVFAQVTVLVGQRARPVPGRPGGTEAARLRRVHLQFAGPRRAEYFGTFVRGERVRAVAGRVEVRAVPPPASDRTRRRVERWVLVELSIV